MSAATDAEPMLTAAHYAPYVDVRETHTGVVFLAGDRAFKAKKPILTEFLDFRTPQQREHACRREVDLNRRLSPESYLGIAHLSDPTGGPAEPIVVMRRYRNEDRLAFMVTRTLDGSVHGALDAIAEILARFHESADRSPAIDTAGTAASVGQRWRDNLAELHTYVGMLSADTLAGVWHQADQFMAGRDALFARRIAEGFIVDGHGDLLADDIFCGHDKPVLLDCLEFDDQLRHLDCIDDAAFLAMDLEFLGRKELGEYFLRRYAVHSGRSAPLGLRSFYIAYRALVRAKVDCLRMDQGKSGAASDAARHLDIARQHLQAGAVRLALVAGEPGTGKSTVAQALAEHAEAQVISTDDVRRELREAGTITGSPGALDEGLYSPSNVATVYREVLRRAATLLGDGESVVLDGTWRDPPTRAQARRLATQTHSDIIEFVCAPKADVAPGRIATRPPGNSEVTPDIAAALAARHTGWGAAHRIDTSRPIEYSLREALAVWNRRW